MTLSKPASKVVKFVAPVAAATAALAYVLSQFGSDMPWCRPEGLGVEVKRASEGSPYQVTKVVTELSDAGRPIAVSLFAVGKVETGTSSEPSPRLDTGSASLAAQIRTVPIVLAASQHGDAVAGESMAVDTIALGRTALQGTASIKAMSVPHMRSRTDEVSRSGDYTHRLLLLAKAGDWQAIGQEIERFGGDARSITAPPPATAGSGEQQTFAYAGSLEPSADPKVLAQRLAVFRYPELGPPIVLVTSLGADWKHVYDVTFNALKGKDQPLVGLCIDRMSEAEMLAIPEFVQRYSGQHGGIIANYDLSNADFLPGNAPRNYDLSVDRVSLVLRLTRRSDTDVPVYLAVGYNQKPSWQSWIAQQPRECFTGIVLVGPTTRLAFAYRQACRFPVRDLRKTLGDAIPIGLVSFWNPVTTKVLSQDEQAVRQEYALLKSALQEAGISFVHIMEESQ